MSFQATINVGSGEDESSYTTFPLLYYMSEVRQHVNQQTSRSGVIWFMIEETGDGTFSSWMSDPSQKMNGVINIYSYDEPGTVFKQIKFKEASVSRYMEGFAVDEFLDVYDSYFTQADDRFDGNSSDVEVLRIIDRLIRQIQNSTKINYLTFGTIYAEKVSIDGVDHDNLEFGN